MFLLGDATTPLDENSNPTSVEKTSVDSYKKYVSEKAIRIVSSKSDPLSASKKRQEMGKKRLSKAFKAALEASKPNSEILLTSPRDMDKSSESTQNKSVTVLHFTHDHYIDKTTVANGIHECGDIKCDWLHSEKMKILKLKYEDSVRQSNGNGLTVALYNTHTLMEKKKGHNPINCDWQTDFTMATSEESHTRFEGWHFNNYFKNFDGIYTSK